MKTNLKLKSTVLLFLTSMLLVDCTQTESDFSEEPQITSINVSASQSNILEGATVTFSATSNLGTNVTSETSFYVNDVLLTSPDYTFTEAGSYNVTAVYGTLSSAAITITVSAPVVSQTQYKNRVLVEEYSGTWCGNCPRILYGTELLKQQTDNAVSVQIHLFGNDPFITNAGNALATEQGISGVPTGKINRTINWNGPQYQNVNQVINEIKPSSAVGLAISSTLNASTLSVSIQLGFASNAPQTKLTVYIVEDNLRYTKANYSANLYGGLSSIPNFEYDGVLRSVVTPTSGETISASENQKTKTYTVNVLPIVSNTDNVKIVAFLTDSGTNTVLNVRQATVGQSQSLETF